MVSALRGYLDSQHLRDKSRDIDEMFSHLLNVHRHGDTLRDRLLDALDPTKQPLTEIQPPGLLMSSLEHEIHIQLNEHRLPRDLHDAIADDQFRHVARTTPQERLRSPRRSSQRDDPPRWIHSKQLVAHKNGNGQ